jgi:hypothetical protein
MRKIASITVAALVSVAMTPMVASAEPMVLTGTQMESITAAGPPFGINININVTTQIANAKAIAIATCGVCIGNAPAAFSLAAASNANATKQIQR